MQDEAATSSGDDEDDSDRRTIQAHESGDELMSSATVLKGRSKTEPKSLMVNGNGMNGRGGSGRDEVEVKKEEKTTGQLSMEPHVVDGVS